MLGRRLAPLAALAAVAFAVGVLVGGTGDDPRRDTAQSFVDAWSRFDYAAMRGTLSPAALKRTSARALRPRLPRRRAHDDPDAA